MSLTGIVKCATPLMSTIAFCLACPPNPPKDRSREERTLVPGGPARRSAQFRCDSRGCAGAFGRRRHGSDVGALRPMRFVIFILADIVAVHRSKDGRNASGA